MKTVSLDLACGPNIRNPYVADEVIGVDIMEYPGVITADLCLEPIPMPDNSVDYVTAYDFLEHLPRVLYIGTERREPFIDVMNEVWRVLKPGGLFLAHTPAYPSIQAFQDPTHVNFISANTVFYFAGEMTQYIPQFTGKFVQHQQQYWFDDAWLVWELAAVKSELTEGPTEGTI